MKKIIRSFNAIIVFICFFLFTFKIFYNEYSSITMDEGIRKVVTLKDFFTGFDAIRGITSNAYQQVFCIIILILMLAYFIFEGINLFFKKGKRIPQIILASIASCSLFVSFSFSLAGYIFMNLAIFNMSMRMFIDEEKNLTYILIAIFVLIIPLALGLSTLN